MGSFWNVVSGVIQMFQYKPEIFWTMLFFLTFVVLLWKNKLPSIEGFSQFVQLADTRGGNIIILSVFTFISLVWAIRFGYYSIHAINRAIATGAAPPPDTAIQLMMSWLTGSVSSGFMGALIKTMTGEHKTITVDSDKMNTKDMT
jgi:predicted small integral membrane protein